MYFLYVDDSGDSGHLQRWSGGRLKRSPTKAFALGVLAVHDQQWNAALDTLIEFRRKLRDRFGLPLRAELKANHLVTGYGPWADLPVSPEARMRAYRMALTLVSKASLGQTFAVVVNKVEMDRQKDTDNIKRRAWQLLFERAATFTRKSNENCLILPDSGDESLVQRMLREQRRFHRVPSQFNPSQHLDAQARTILEDPVHRESTDSYFIQQADLIAYAAVRRCFPEQWCGRRYWDLLSDSRVSAVDDRARQKGAPGIKLWPPLKTWEMPL